MKNVSLFKKIALFYDYKKIIKENKDMLEQNLNIRVDKAYRLYTVLNVPEELIGDAFALRKTDIDKISETYIKEYISEASKVLRSIGLNELFSFYETKKVSKYSYLIVLGFSLFKTQKFYNNLYFRVIPITIIVAITTFLLLRYT